MNGNVNDKQMGEAHTELDAPVAFLRNADGSVRELHEGEVVHVQEPDAEVQSAKEDTRH